MGISIKIKKLLILWGVISILSCTEKKTPLKKKAEYDTLALIHTILREHTIKKLLYDTDTNVRYNDSIYIVRTALSDSVLSAIMLADKKVGFLPMPDQRPFMFDSTFEKQIIWFRILHLDEVKAAVELYMNGYNQIHEMELQQRNNKWIVKKTNVAHF